MTNNILIFIITKFYGLESTAIVSFVVAAVVMI